MVGWKGGFDRPGVPAYPLIVSRSLLLLLSLVWTAHGAGSSPPYPGSSVLTGIEFHEDTLERKAPGSDIWACTTASDGTIYTTWGDGGGFGGTDSEGRVSIGVARITGVLPKWEGVNLWGGANALSPQAPTVGKGTIIAVGERIYLFVSEQDKWDRCRLWRSADQGLSWSDRGWIFPQSHKVFAFPGLVQYGAEAGARAGGYVYGFSDNDPRRGMDRKLYLFRVKAGDVGKTDAYEYFSGTDRSPRWSGRVEDRAPVFENPAGIAWGTTCVYHRVTGRHLLAVTTHELPGDWGLYESEHLWGPWRTVAYGDDLPEWTYAPAEKGRPAYLHTFPTHWISPDGKTLWCVFDHGDHFNLSRCTLRLR